MRLDLYLTAHQLAKSRTEAARLIGEGLVTVAGKVQTKSSYPIDEEHPLAEVVINREVHPFVSRGGEKLEAAIRAFGLSPEGCDALDVGASSGGFTDCLLRHGARRVYAVDAGSGQLAAALRADPVRSRQILERIPAGRWGEASDIAGACVFLCSPAADYVHGIVLPVDGGWLAR